MATLKATVNLNQAMHEAAETCRTFAITAAFNVANGALNRLAQRAVELKDEQLIDELRTIGYIV